MRDNGAEVVERRGAFPRCLTRPSRPVRTPEGFPSDALRLCSAQACSTHAKEAPAPGREAPLARIGVVSPPSVYRGELLLETLHALYKGTAGIEVHRRVHALTVLIEHDDGSMTQEQRPFGGFRGDKRARGCRLAYPAW